MRTDWHAVAFTKTVGWEPRDRDDDELVDYAGLVGWCAARGLVDEREASELTAQATRRPAEAAEALDAARSLRALLYQIFSRIGRGGDPDAGQIEELNHRLRKYLPARRLALEGSAVRWAWRHAPYQLDLLLGPIVWSAADLLTSPEAERLKLCVADDCGWLFIDGSRNRSRRWCDMSDCGNRAKARRFRERRLRTARSVEGKPS